MSSQEEYERKIAELESEISSLKDHVEGNDLEVFSQNKSLKSEIHQMQQSLEKLTDECMQQALEIRSLKTEVESKNTLALSREEELSGIQEALSKEQKAREDAESLVQQAKAELEESQVELQSKIESLHGEIEELKGAHQSFDSERKDWDQTKQEIEEEKARILAEKEALLKEKEALVADSEHLSAQLSELEQESASLKSVIDEKEALFASVGSEVEALKSQLAQKDSERDDLANKLERFKSEFLGGRPATKTEPQEDAQREADDEVETEASESPYQIMSERMQGFVGYAGKMFVDKAYTALEVSKESTDSSALEQVFDTIYETAGKLVGHDDQQDYDQFFQEIWSTLGLDAPLSDSSVEQGALETTELLIDSEAAESEGYGDSPSSIYLNVEQEDLEDGLVEDDELEDGLEDNSEESEESGEYSAELEENNDLNDDAKSEDDDEYVDGGLKVKPPSGSYVVVPGPLDDEEDAPSDDVEPTKEEAEATVERTVMVKPPVKRPTVENEVSSFTGSYDETRRLLENFDRCVDDQNWESAFYCGNKLRFLGQENFITTRQKSWSKVLAEVTDENYQAYAYLAKSAWIRDAEMAETIDERLNSLGNAEVYKLLTDNDGIATFLYRYVDSSDELTSDMLSHCLYYFVDNPALYEELNRVSPDTDLQATMIELFAQLYSGPRADALALEQEKNLEVSELSSRLLNYFKEAASHQKALVEVFLGHLLPSAGFTTEELVSPQLSTLLTRSVDVDYSGPFGDVLSDIDLSCFDFETMPQILTTQEYGNIALDYGFIQSPVVLLFDRAKNVPDDELKALIISSLASLSFSFAYLKSLRQGLSDEKVAKVVESFLELSSQYEESFLTSLKQKVSDSVSDDDRSVLDGIREVYSDTQEGTYFDLLEMFDDSRLYKSRLRSVTDGVACKVVGLTSTVYSFLYDYSDDRTFIADVEQRGLKVLFEREHREKTREVRERIAYLFAYILKSQS